MKHDRGDQTITPVLPVLNAANEFVGSICTGRRAGRPYRLSVCFVRQELCYESMTELSTGGSGGEVDRKGIIDSFHVHLSRLVGIRRCCLSANKLSSLPHSLRGIGIVRAESKPDCTSSRWYLLAVGAVNKMKHLVSVDKPVVECSQASRSLCATQVYVLYRLRMSKFATGYGLECRNGSDQIKGPPSGEF
jgi:hypothetical protein